MHSNACVSFQSTGTSLRFGFLHRIIPVRFYLTPAVCVYIYIFFPVSQRNEPESHAGNTVCTHNYILQVFITSVNGLEC